MVQTPLGGAQARMATIFSPVPNSWSVVLAAHVTPTLSVAPIALVLQEKGYSVQTDSSGKAVVMKGGEALSESRFAGEAQRAQVDAHELLDSVAAELMARCESKILTPREKTEAIAQLKIISRNPGLTGYFTGKRLEEVRAAREQAWERLTAQQRADVSAAQARILLSLRWQLREADPAPDDAGLLEWALHVQRSQRSLSRVALEKPAQADRVQEALRTMPAGWREQITKQYQQSLRKEAVESLFLAPGGVERIYGRRWEAGEDHAHTLVDLGYQSASNDTGEAVLRPPADFKVLFIRYAQRMQELIAAGEVNESEVIYPSLIFTGVLKSQKTRYLFIRPGIDPWPTGVEGVEPINKAVELPYDVYYKALAEGKMPLSLIYGLRQHDEAHVSEFFSHPRIMAQTRQYATRVNPAELEANENSGPALRNWILSEFFVLPDIRKASLILRLMPQWFDRRHTPKSLAEAELRLKSLSPDERSRYVSSLIEQAHSVLARHGGAARDYYNDKNLDSNYLVLRRIYLAIAKNTDDPSDRINHAVRESLYSLIREIALVHDIRYRPATPAFGLSPDKISSFSEDLRTRNPPVTDDQLDRLLDERTALFEMALYQAVRLKLTAEKVYEEARLAPPPPGSATYQYFSSIARPGSVYAKAFLEEP